MRWRSPLPACAALAAILALSPSPALPAEPGKAEETDYLSAFSKASVDWGNGVEGIIEEAYRDCFKTYIIDGRVLTLHMPFGQNNERSELAEGDLEVIGGGKADPLLLWEDIDTLLASEDFRSYVSALSDGREKIMAFDLEARTWVTTRDWFSIDRMKSGSYPGLPHKPFVLTRGTGVTAADVYNYIYSVGRLGMDCSGFVWYTQKSVAAAGGLDLDRAVSKAIGIPRRANTSLYVGTWFFDPRNKLLQEVVDEVRNLKPGDIILFRGEDGTTRHSAVIQSVDMASGTIRYLQSTDEAPQDVRGVHESVISFDPSNPRASLKDPSIVWHQRRRAPFSGEMVVLYNDDGERYRAYPETGGGTIVRLKMLQPVIDKRQALAKKQGTGGAVSR